MKFHAKNIFSLFGFEAVIRLLGFLSTAYLARVLGSGTFGIVNLGLALYSYGMILVSPGLHILGTRAISQESSPENSVVRQITSLRFVLSLITCATLIAISFWVIVDSTTRIIVVLYAVSLVPFAFQLSWYFQGKQRIAAIGLTQSTALTVFLLLVIVMVKSSGSAYLVPIAYFINNLVFAVLLLALYIKGHSSAKADGVQRKSFTQWKLLLAQSLPVGGATILSQFLLNLPIILLGVFSTTIDIGFFSAASKLVFFLLAIDRALYVLYYPLVSRTFSMNPANLSDQVQRILNYLLLLALPICAGGVILSSRIVDLVFGPSYARSDYLFQILLFYFLFTILNSIFAYLLIAVGKERRYSTIITSVSGICMIALLPLTYYWKGAGAAYGMAGGELLMMSLMYVECRSVVLINVAHSLWRPLLGSLVMGIVLLTCYSRFSLTFCLVAGVATYVLTVVILRGFTKDDYQFLRERLI